MRALAWPGPAWLRRSAAVAAVAAVAIALLCSVAAVWFSSEVVATARNDEIAAAPLTDRVVLVVIDGLRHDTALESDLMPGLRELGRAGASGLSLASNVTMTGLGVRTLGTGSSPALADILLEARLPPVTFDNLFAALRRRGGHIAWFGNPAWRELFGAFIDLDPRIDRELEVMSRADNVWAADRVIVRRAVRMMVRRDWQLCVVHLGGLDNASHRFTPFGEAFRAKAKSVDADIAQLVAAAGERTTVIITSDHGTSDRGHHGSGEAITRRTPLVLTGAAIGHGRTLDASQTDVVPTIAALLGLPIPAPSEGQVLLDALDVPAATAGALRDANVRQLQRYADAYAAAHAVAPPTIEATPAGMRRLGAWIEDERTGAIVVPALWALGLAFAALALFAAPSSIGAVVVAIAAASAATGGQSAALAILAVLATGASAFVALRRLSRRWPRLSAGAAVLAAIATVEVLLAVWKLNHRFLEMRMHDVYQLLHLSELGFGLAGAVAVAIAGTLAARRWWPRPTTRWAVIGAVFAAAALADSLAIPAALAAGAIAVAATLDRRELAPIVVAGLAGVAAIAIARLGALDRAPLELAAPLAVAGLGAWLGPVTRPGRIALVAFGVAVTLVRAAGDPAIAYRLTLVALVVIPAVLARRLRLRDEQPLALVGWAAAIALAMLSRSSQLPGLVAWTSFAALVGRSRQLEASTEHAALVATLAALAFRFACVALFEGELELSHVEVWLAYRGNPGTTVAFGAAIIAFKFTLPLVIGPALVTARMTGPARRCVVGWIAAFLALRIAHIVIGMTVARGTFYSPYLDSGQLIFTYLMLASTPLVIAWLAGAGAWSVPGPPRAARAA